MVIIRNHSSLEDRQQTMKKYNISKSTKSCFEHLSTFVWSSFIRLGSGFGGFCEPFQLDLRLYIWKIVTIRSQEILVFFAQIQFWYDANQIKWKTFSGSGFGGYCEPFQLDLRLYHRQRGLLWRVRDWGFSNVLQYYICVCVYVQAWQLNFSQSFDDVGHANHIFSKRIYCYTLLHPCYIPMTASYTPLYPVTPHICHIRHTNYQRIHKTLYVRKPIHPGYLCIPD